MNTTTLNTLPSADGFHMPAEWAPQQAVWMIWPYRPDNWRQHGKPAQQTFAAVAKAIAAATPVFMAVPAAHMAQAKKAMPAEVTLVEMESDDCWMRDSGPTMVRDANGALRGVDWQFNAWGGFKGGLYAPWDQDSAVAGQVLGKHGFARYTAPLVLEGGSIHVDGEGTLMTTAECLLNENRNPELNQAQIEALLSDYLGVTHFIWLPEGVFMDETDGHIDNMCCFARPGEVVLHWVDDENDPQYARSQAAFEALTQARDAKGRALKIHKMPAPGPLYYSAEETAEVEASGHAVPRQAGERMAASYVNFLISNRQVIFPLLDARTDADAAKRLQDIFPDYRIVGVPAREILLGGGNIHCITQQIPTGV
ncbi:MAG: agmatine deiminase [Paludibacterium sp.]|uniref:agmatine deiminase n=1 Tax=Paludibacterium sp. TaxID=1917523 RepID=UPI0025ECF866|nr:agmatine deiminase [Paludibacterium sp.]MBV8046760.1 agmatine deiminase [Paludibacterium sp.]MBV8649505.1 agmatine deiminase [Paludibacterium sp.]